MMRYVTLVATITFVLAAGELNDLSSVMADGSSEKKSQVLEASEGIQHQRIQSFLKNYCLECHGKVKPKAKFRVDDLISSQFSSSDVKRWQIILEMVELGDMPPEDELQPKSEKREAFEATLIKKLQSINEGKHDWERELPKYANRVDHDALFSGEHLGPAFTKARAWRINGQTYAQLMRDLDIGYDFLVPLQTNVDGFKDYSKLYADEATIRSMMQNAKRAADAMLFGRLDLRPKKNNQQKAVRPNRYGSKHREVKAFLAIEGQPSPKQLDDMASYFFSKLLLREPSTDEVRHHVNEMLKPTIDAVGIAEGLRGYVVSLLISPEFLFRRELGLGKQLPDGRRMLSSVEIAYALSFTLHDHPVKTLLKAADAGTLNNKSDVEREFRKMYANPKLLRGRSAVGANKMVWLQVKDHRSGSYAKPRLARFFQEYFEYTKAMDVFKDDTRHGGKHEPRRLIKDADWTVLHILADDKKVLERLLTTDRFTVEYWMRPKRGQEDQPRRINYLSVYNIEASPWKDSKGLVEMPKNQRVGMLTHPAWLIAHSTNFHTDPVRRGKWIMEHLLGYPVPELPIAVQAQLPEWHDKTIRERFSVVEKNECWRCHKKMNPLGNPFEAYDDFGRWRDKHLVDTKGNIVEAEFESMYRKSPAHIKEAKLKIPVVTTGELYGTGDPKLDGPVKDAADLMHRLAKSERVRQVFIRHVFRYWMGRNETLDDSPTLMAMDKAYFESGGSFKETLVALVTSDSFLYRK